MKFTAIALALSVALACNDCKAEHNDSWEHHDDDGHKAKTFSLRHDDDDWHGKAIVIAKAPVTRGVWNGHEWAEAIDASKDYSKKVVKTELNQLHEQTELLAKSNQKAAVKAAVKAHEEAEKKEKRDDRHAESWENRKVAHVQLRVAPVEAVTHETAEASAKYARGVAKTEFHQIKDQQKLQQKVNAVGIHKNGKAAQKNIHEWKEDIQEWNEKSAKLASIKLAPVKVVSHRKKDDDGEKSQDGKKERKEWNGKVWDNKVWNVKAWNGKGWSGKAWTDGHSEGH